MKPQQFFFVLNQFSKYRKPAYSEPFLTCVSIHIGQSIRKASWLDVTAYRIYEFLGVPTYECKLKMSWSESVSFQQTQEGCPNSDRDNGF